MALVYRRSDSKTARAYERSRGMEPNGLRPNPGVSHLTVVQNPKKRRTSRRVEENPFQWIEGRGQRHRHVSPEYETIRGAVGWKKRNKQSTARLYPVDRRGTIVSRPVSSKLLSNGGSEMAYNIGALRRAMRSNPRGRRVSEKETSGGVKVSSRGKARRNTKRRTTRRRKPTANRRRARKTTRNRSRRRSRKPKSNRRRSRRRTSRRRRSRKPRRNSRRRASRRKPRRNSRRRSSRRPRRNSRRRSSRRPRRNSRRRSTRRRSTRRNSRRRSSRQPRRNAKRGGKKRSSRRSSRRYHGRREVKARGAEYLDKYIQKGYMPTVAPRYRTGKSRSGVPPVLVYPVASGHGRLSKRKTRRSTKSTRGPRKRKRARSVGSSYRGTRARRMTANRKRRRTSRRRSTRRNSRRRSRRPGIYANRRRKSRRSSRRHRSRRPRRNTRRRSSRRKVRKNLLSTSKVRYGGRGKFRRGRPVGRTFQVLAYGPGSKTRRTSKGKRRRVLGYPVYIPGHVIETAAVRRFRGLGGAAKDSHSRAKARGYRERKRYPRRRVRRNTRRTSMRRNRRRSRRRSTRRNSRRRSTRRNPKYVVANRRRRSSRRRVRKNQGFFGADLMRDVVTPVIGGTAGFVAARVLSNGAANIEGVRNILDKDKPAADATNTKIAANVLGIIATLGLGTRVKLIKDNQGALITGMGLALTDRLLGMVQGDAAGYLGGFGEYVSQPLGEYVSQPLGEYVSQPLGAYVGDGMGETLYAAAGLGMPVMEAAAGMGMPVMEAAAGYHEGVDPANQAGVDGMMDAMEGAMYATAGMGETLYAAAGLGAEADASLKAMYARSQPPFASIQTPTDVAKPVSRTLPFARPVPDSLVTPEGRGYAGGLFARNLFAGML